MSGSATLTTGHARRLDRMSRLIAACLLVLGACSAANAHSWHCQAPAGKYADHDIAVPETTTQLTGEMVIHQAEGPTDWRPMARIGFTDLGLEAPGCHCNAIVATWYPEHPDSFYLALSVDGEQTPLGLVPADKPVKFKLTFAWDGGLKLEVGDAVATGRSSTPRRNNLELSCSTADVAFNDVEIWQSNERTPERCPFAAQERWLAQDVERYCRVRREGPPPQVGTPDRVSDRAAVSPR